MRSAASTIAWAGTSSSFEIDVVVAAGASLDWQLQPLIASGRCRFSQRCRVELSTGASLRWAEEVVLGRSGEQPGTLDLRLEVNLDGAPLLRHQLALGPNVPGWDGPSVLGANRAMAIVLLAGTFPAGALSTGTGSAGAGPGASSPGSGRSHGGAGHQWAVMPLEGPGVLVCALARDHLAVRAAMAQAFAACGAVGSGLDD